MRVALLSHSANAGDAIGRQLAEKVAFFLDRGADVRLFVETDRALNPGLRPYTFRFAPPRTSGPLWRFLSSADLVIVEYSQHFALLDLLPRLAGGKSRILFDYHGVTPPALGLAGHRDALERGLRLRGLVWYADAALVHSRFMRRDLREATGFSAAATYALGYPVDGAWFAPGPVADSLRQNLGLPSDSHLLLFVGRVAPNKRVPTLVEALAHLRERTPAVHAVIVGSANGGYEAERERCRERAHRCGVQDRVHFLGHAGEAALRDAYRDATILVLPSIHEGFGIPIVEGLACGLPVIAARAAALPETVGDAGLTFRADDARDLARQIGRVLDSQAAPRGKGAGGEERAESAVPHPAPQTPLPRGAAQISHATESPRKIAVVTPRYGSGFVGGAESSLRILAESLHGAGQDVEVFTTCAGNGRIADNQLPERSAAVERFAVHRYFTDPVDLDRWARAAANLQQGDGAIDADDEYAFLQNSLRSSRLIAALRQRGPFDAIFVGPGVLGLTYDVARAFPDRTILLPCFHDEPLARLPALHEAYESAGGILYHSPEERAFAEATLGLNHPNVHVLGTFLNPETSGDARRGRARVGTGRRYLLYCGRYHRDKGLPELFCWAEHVAIAHPERFSFVFTGLGDLPIPDEPWARDLGYVDDRTRRDLMAGADALVLLSPNESLSLAVLEAQAEGTPVIVGAGSEVLAGHIARGGGGQIVDGCANFAAALDDLWNHPERWRDLGQRGQDYVRRAFGDRDAYAGKWQAAIENLNVGLADRLRVNAARRALAFDRPAWREQFATVIDRLLDAPARPAAKALDIESRTAAITAAAGTGVTGVPVRLVNRGHHPEAAEGANRTEIRSRVVDADGQQVGAECSTPLPGLLLPGRDAVAVVRVAVPAAAGQFTVELRIHRHGCEPSGTTEVPVRVELTASSTPAPAPTSFVTPAHLQASLLAAESAQRLPDCFTDISEGRFRRLKLWLKRKLLHNFQHAYVNVLSRQQSAFNRQVLNALAEVGDAQATFAHAARLTDESADLQALRDELRDLRQRYRRLARQMALQGGAAVRTKKRPSTQGRAA